MNDQQNNTPAPRHPMTASVRLDLPHRVCFVRGAFDPQSDALVRAFADAQAPRRRVLVVVDQGLVTSQHDLQARIESYFAAHRLTLPQLVGFRTVPGGEDVKNDLSLLESLLGEFNRLGIDRHSYVMAIGGGAMLDMVGFAAAVTHRGVRLMRLPTTSLAQCDSGIGVKNSVNMFGKKNFIGTFAVPWAVVNDLEMLRTLSDRDWRCGLSEAVKVALLKSPALYDQILRSAQALAARDEAVADPIWQACAELHYQHIVHGGDPYELTRSRPLDFGHWAAHKLEQMTHFSLRHGEAVAVGLAVDVCYAAAVGLLTPVVRDQIIALLAQLGFDLWCPQLRDEALFDGIEEFREHLGGELTITLIRDVGRPVDVHQIDVAALRQATDDLGNHQVVAGAAARTGGADDE